MCVALVAAAAVAVAVVAVAPELEAPPQLFSDFDINVWEPGRAILDGRSPLRGLDAEPQNGSVYPPAAEVATLPFALLPHDVGLVLWLGTLGAAVAFALRLCGVRDWRLFAVALCSPPVLYGLAYANLSLLLTFALALTWVWRDRHRRAAIAVGALIAGRLFLWPLLVWLVITRRFRAAVEALIATIVLSLAGWAVVAFRRIDEFTHVVRDNASEYVDDGVSVASIASNLGLSVTAASALGLAAAIAALGLAWWARERDSSRSRGSSWPHCSPRRSSGAITTHFSSCLSRSRPRRSFRSSLA